jgi:hypothetical protein
MFRAFAGAAVLFAAVSSPVHAGPIIDVVNPTDVFVSFGATPTCPAGMTCGSGTLTFVHDITDNGFQIGDIIGSAHIDIRLAELIATGANLETYRYSFATQAPEECLNGNCVPNPGVLDTISLVAGLPDLAADGKISITLSALSGSFYFASSQLTVEFSPAIQVLTETEPSDLQTAAVPVPSTLLLLGAGLMALRSRLRRHAEG